MEGRLGGGDVPEAVRTVARPEREIQREILRYFVGRPDVLIWRNNTGFGYTTAGSPVRFGLVGSADLIGCYAGRFLAIETKAPGGRLTKEQAAFRDAVQRTGGVWILARSVDDVAREVPPR
jgi:hypothetical protein